MSTASIQLRVARPDDLEAVVALDAARGGELKPAYWSKILDAYVDSQDEGERVAVIACSEGGTVCGFVFGEVRAWEFGSERCGWIFAVNVRPGMEREGLATRLCEEAIKRFAGLGVRVVRTMIRRQDVPMLALFRSMGFVAGPFSEMERPVGDAYDAAAACEGGAE